MAKILITGGTGLLGKSLTERLVAGDHEVVLLSRNPCPSSNRPVTEYKWDLEQGYIDPAALTSLDHVVHLAGAGIADQRWTGKRKKEIIDSRVKSMALLERGILEQGVKLKSFTGASAISYYGMATSDAVFSEEDHAEKKDFLVDCCMAWEESYKQVILYSARHTVIRIGVVLSRQGGALKKMLPLFKLGLGSPLGNGRQYMPWIHVDDLTEIFYQSLFNDQFQGIYNAVAPQDVTNALFSETLARALNKPFFVPPVPAFILRLLYGEMSGLLLEGSRVNPGKLLETGFRFKYTGIEQALLNIVK